MNEDVVRRARVRPAEFAEVRAREQVQRDARVRVLAVPVVAADVLPTLRRTADEVVYVAAPAQFRAVGEWYDDFRQVTDDEVAGLLQISPSGAP